MTTPDFDYIVSKLSPHNPVDLPLKESEHKLIYVPLLMGALLRLRLGP